MTAGRRCFEREDGNDVDDGDGDHHHGQKTMVVTVMVTRQEMLAICNNHKMISAGSGAVAASWMVMTMISDDDGRDQVTIFRGCWHPGFHPPPFHRRGSMPCSQSRRDVIYFLSIARGTREFERRRRKATRAAAVKKGGVGRGLG